MARNYAEEVESLFILEGMATLSDEDRSSLLYLISNLEKDPRRAIAEPTFGGDRWRFTSHYGSKDLARLLEMTGAELEVFEEGYDFPTYDLRFNQKR